MLLDIAANGLTSSACLKSVYNPVSGPASTPLVVATDKILRYSFRRCRVRAIKSTTPAPVIGVWFSLQSGHNDAAVEPQHRNRSDFAKMPSLFRFLTITGILASLVLGGLYILATQYEPEQKEVRKVVPSVTIRRE